MTDISVIVVDDSDTDRYIARRILNRADGFTRVEEQVSGDAFLSELYEAKRPIEAERPPVLVLMDINMPGRDGFETVETLQSRIANGDGPDDIVVVICTSSAHVKDKQRAARLRLVEGFLTKPIDQSGIEQLREIYQARRAG